MTFKLQILHASDLEGGVDAIQAAPNFAAIEQALEQDAANNGFASITLSAGDNYLSGPFFNAASDPVVFNPLFEGFYNEQFGLINVDLLNEANGENNAVDTDGNGFFDNGEIDTFLTGSLNTNGLVASDIYTTDVNGDGFVDYFDELDNFQGRVDLGIINAIGFDASALGNHEFDLGTDTLENIIQRDLEEDNSLSSTNEVAVLAEAPDHVNFLQEVDHVGIQLPYLSANLDFSNDPEVGNLFTSEIRSSSSFQLDLTTARADINDPTVTGSNSSQDVIAPTTFIEVTDPETGAVEQIGVIGATTPLLESISSPGGVEVLPASDSIAELAEIINGEVARLEALGINKIVVVSHLQQFSLENDELAPLLNNVDVIIAGGSDTISADAEDVARGLQPGDEAEQPYPSVVNGADGSPTAIVSTNGEYSYVGRLVIEFDENGNFIPESVDPNVSGTFATTDAGVAALYDGSIANLPEDPFAEGTQGETVQDLVNAVTGVVNDQDGNITGQSDVFLNGARSSVRTEETNFGNLTADANLSLARSVDEDVVISLKNGGGIRDIVGFTGQLEQDEIEALIANIEANGGDPELAGFVDSNGDGVVDSNDTFNLPTLANGPAGKDFGDLSQLDIANSLRFDNDLELVTLTAEQLKEVLEHAVAGSDATQDATPGQFAQVAGIRFSFDPNNQARQFNPETLEQTVAGERIVNAVIETTDGLVEFIVDGEISEDIADIFPNGIRIVTLDFLEGGGDAYPYPVFEALDPEFYNEVDLQAAELQELIGSGEFDFSDAGEEQDALAEFNFDNFNVDNAGAAFPFSDTPIDADQRIQNLAVREDEIFDNEGFEGLQGSSDDDEIEGSDDDDTIFGNAGDDEIEGDDGNDSLFGGEGDDELEGEDGDDLLVGGAGDDELDGDDGEDLLFGGSGDDELDGGDGDDTLDGGLGSDELEGDDGNDTLFADLDDVSIDGGDDEDTIELSNIEEGIIIDLSAGTLTGNINDNEVEVEDIENVVGSDFDDEITGNADDNVLEGRGGNDILVGLQGTDTILGGEGDDTIALIDTVDQDEVLDGGEGEDTLDLTSLLEGVSVDLDTANQGINLPGEPSQNGTLTGAESGNVSLLTDIENVIGTEEDDVIFGNNEENNINAGGGDDRVHGFGGADVLDGGEGNDTLLVSGAPQGVVVDLEVGTSGQDTISNFENVEGSQFDDTLIGDENDNVLSGNAGDDSFVSNGGNDTFDGGEGSDTADFSSSESGVVADLSSGNAIINGASVAFVANGTDTAEIVAFDAVSQQLFVAGGEFVDVFDGEGNLVTAIPVETEVTSVAVSNGLLAAAVPADPETEPGSVLLFNIADIVEGEVPTPAAVFTVGSLPDSVTFTPDGSRIIVANEGEADDGVDPEGSISIIDVATGTVLPLTFNAFDAQEDALIAEGLLIFGQEGGADVTVSQDVEPEFIAVAPDGSQAFVTLQENNAIAVVDLSGDTPVISDILPLGTKDLSQPENGIDGANDGNINIEPIDNAVALFQPDGITSFELNGRTFFATANEGDARDFDESNLENADLDPTIFPNAAELQDDDTGIGNLEVSLSVGDTDGDGDLDQLAIFGGRSFSILDDAGNTVFESGNQLETIITERFPAYFDDGRADDAGPEPEAVAFGVVNGEPILFVGLERYASVVAFRLEEENGSVDAEFAGFIGLPTPNGFPFQDDDGFVSPEGLAFVPAADSPSGQDLLIVSDEGSGRTFGFNLTLNATASIELVSIENLTGSNFDDDLRGNDEDNIINALAGDDFIEAGDGNDTINAGEGNDFIDAGNGDDTIDAGAGDDFVLLGDGLDFADGGEGNDTVSFENAESRVVATITNNGVRVRGEFCADELINFENIVGTDFNDILRGNNAANILNGGEGDDRLIGNGGDDTLIGGEGNDDLRGGNGNDILNGSDGNDNLRGDNGNDILNGGDGNDTLRGGNGTDTLNGGEGDDNLRGDNGNDILNGGDGNDTLRGGNGTDTLDGGEGDDNLRGDNGDDILNGGDGNDTLRGGNGTDTLDGGEGDDTLRGDNGNDILNGGDGVDILMGGNGRDELNGGADRDVLRGDGGNDMLNGGAGNDVINGGSGADELIGGEGDDTLFGDSGNDILIGGEGNDILFGGSGRDTAVFIGNEEDFTVAGNRVINNVDGSIDILVSVENIVFEDPDFNIG